MNHVGEIHGGIRVDFCSLLMVDRQSLFFQQDFDEGDDKEEVCVPLGFHED